MSPVFLISCSQWIRQKEKDILDDILGVNYDKRIRPAGKVYDPGALTGKKFKLFLVKFHHI